MLTAALFFGLCGFFITELARKLPIVETWALAGKRPWSCNVCMSAWSTLAAYLAQSRLAASWQDLPTVAAGAGVSLLVLSLVDWTIQAKGPE